jgi:hypothetical protein
MDGWKTSIHLLERGEINGAVFIDEFVIQMRSWGERISGDIKKFLETIRRQ